MRKLAPTSPLALLTCAFAFALAPAGCGDDGGGSAVDASTIDADPDAINGCTRATALDLSAAADDRTIAQVDISYTPRCIRIKKGQSVTWDAEFTFHPMTSGSPSTGEQPGSPITQTSSGTTVTFNFPDEGVFGFWCEEHGRAMMGAIYVEP
jgi:plastocyanin